MDESPSVANLPSMQRTVLWQHADFLRLWLGQSVSQFGSQIGGMALELTAILVLGATPIQLGILSAARSAPVLAVGLLAGVWVDRVRRRPLLIAADLGRALLLASIPTAWLLGALSMAQIYGVAALVAILAIVFDIAHQALLPSLVSRRQLVEANSKLGMSESLAESVGPGLAGALVQAISAPLAILLDALSFLASALAVALIRTPEPAPVIESRGMRQEIGEGLRAIGDDPRQRALLATTLTTAFFGGMIGALYSLFVLRALGLSPLVLGVVIGCGGIGAFSGAALAERVRARLRLGRVLVLSLALGGGFQLLMPLAGGDWAVPMLIVAQILGDVGLSIFFIHERSLRQSLTPDRLLGRVNASREFLIALVLPVGALVGGLLGQTVGLRPTLALGVLGVTLACLWIVFSPLHRLDDLPESV